MNRTCQSRRNSDTKKSTFRAVSSRLFRRHQRSWTPQNQSPEGSYRAAGI